MTVPAQQVGHLGRTTGLARMWGHFGRIPFQPLEAPPADGGNQALVDGYANQALVEGTNALAVVDRGSNSIVAPVGANGIIVEDC